MDLQSASQSSTERLIATSRTVIAIIAMLVIWLDPAQPARYAQLTYVALGAYVVYAHIWASLAWHTQIFFPKVRVLSHAIDLAAFSFFVYLNDNLAIPYFLFYVFLVVCAWRRWQRQGILWTALAALVVFVGLGVYRAKVLNDPAFELDDFIIGATYLVVVASLLGYAERYRRRVHNTLSKLVAHPHDVFPDLQAAVRNALARAADILQAPRVLMIWEEQEEPWIYLALWSHHEFSWKREPPGTFAYIVAEPLVHASFLCLNTRAPTPQVFYTSSTGLSRWHGMPLQPDLQKQFHMTTLLAANLRGALFDGHLFFLDKLRLTPDDLVLGNLVTRQVAADLNRFHLVQRRQQVAISEERARLVRNLHDGLLQSLTGIALQLAETNRLLEENPSAARQYLEEVQRLLVDEQRDLRFMVSDVKTTMFDAVEGDLSLASRLESVRQRTQRQWGLRVELNMRLAESLIPPTLIYEIYYIVHEALVNAARHAQATTVQVELGLQHNQVHITIADDGRGFPFHGHYNLAALTYLQLGPLMMKERVTSLGGRLTLDSNSAGARLDILLPLTTVGGRRENGAPTGEGTGG